MKERKKKSLWMILFVILNVAVVAYTAFSEFGGGSKGVKPPRFSGMSIVYLLCALGCMAVLFAAESTKYILMMRTLGEKVSWRTAFETAAIGKYYDNITPFGAGGQPFQIYWLHSHGYSDGASSAMTIVGFIMMQSGFVLLTLATFILWRPAEMAAIRITAFFGLLMIALVPLLLVSSYYFPDKIAGLVAAVLRLGARLHLVKNLEQKEAKVKEEFTEFHNSYRLLAQKKKTLVELQALSVIFSIALYSIPYFVLQALGAKVSYLTILATTTYIYAAVTVVPTPGNSGAAEGAFYVVFSAMEEIGVFWGMLIWRLIAYYGFIAIGGAVYGVNAWKAKRKNEAA